MDKGPLTTGEWVDAVCVRGGERQRDRYAHRYSVAIESQGEKKVLISPTLSLRCARLNGAVSECNQEPTLASLLNRIQSAAAVYLLPLLFNIHSFSFSALSVAFAPPGGKRSLSYHQPIQSVLFTGTGAFFCIAAVLIFNLASPGHLPPPFLLSSLSHLTPC